MIRELRKEDYPMIDSCMKELHEQHVNGRPDLYAPMEHPYSAEEFIEIVKDGTHIAIAAVDEEDTILGFCIARLKEKSGMIENMKNAYVDEIFVRREYRRKGIAKQLFEEMEQRAKAQGAKRVDLMVWGFNESALEFYKSLGMTPQRYILEKHFNRKIYFEKIQNARDLGGLKVSDRRSVAPGRLLRSANLFEATNADITVLKEKYHLAKVVDLRTTVERQEKPDVEIENVNNLSVPVFDERVAGISHEKDMHEKNRKIPIMEDLYCKMVTNESCRNNLSRAAKSVMKHDFSEGSVLWHCTEGKDRCGLLTVILLGALGVDRAQIMEDYLLTNEVNEAKAEKYYQRVLAAGKTEMEAEIVKAAFLAKESYLNAAFNAIDEQYQDMDTYLSRGLGISEELILKFKENVLK